MTAQENHEQPFQPLFTIRRSGKLEVMVYGIVSVVTGQDCQSLMAAGDTGFELWSRSLLKPWQLLSNFKILKSHYPALRDEHFALFMASHSADAGHLKALQEIIEICALDESQLLCPPARPLDATTRALMKEKGEKPQRRYHNCSGKHSGYLAAVKAQAGIMGNYLLEGEAHHHRLKEILALLTGRSSSSFTATTDGCQLPNYALSAREMSLAYMTLLNRETLPAAAQDSDLFEGYEQLGSLMLAYPQMISGLGRLDYKIMAREVFADAPPMVAKEGADGLLGIGVAASEKYPQGVGIAIKLSSGFDSHHMEIIAREILSSLGLTAPHKTEPARADKIKTDHIKSEYHFLPSLVRR
jgi:L-asparaginase II